MRGNVVVEEESAFQAWLQEQPTFAQSLAEARTGTGDGSNLVVSEGKPVTVETGLAR